MFCAEIYLGVVAVAPLAYSTGWRRPRRWDPEEQYSRVDRPTVDSRGPSRSFLLGKVLLNGVVEQTELRRAGPFLHTASRGLFYHIVFLHLHNGCKQLQGR